jgi:glycosyltransferase involved in cell wall biosynthesis
MRLSLVTATPGTTRFGSGTFVATEQLVRGLVRLGHDVRVFRPRTAGRSSLGFLTRRFAFNLGLDRDSVEAAGDAIIGFDMDGWRLSGRTRKPFAAYLHGVIADEARFERGAVAAILRLQAWAEGQTARRADLVLTTSKYSRQRVIDLYGVTQERIAIVQPGIDLASWDEVIARAPHEHREHPTVLAVAHMYPRKNLAALIRATALLRRTMDFRVRIVGIGPEKARLERLTRAAGLEGIISFRGHVDLDTLATEYRSCDVFCLPSLQEGFGLVYIEAMAARRPVVALSTSSTPEIITDGVEGRLAPPGDNAALASCLGETLADRATRERMGRAGRKRAEMFTADRMARGLAQAMAPLTGPAKNSTLPPSLATGS